MNLKSITRGWAVGPILDAIAPRLNATARATLEKRVARWTNEGVLMAEGFKYAGSGHHRRYCAVEVALLAIAETLHQNKIQIGAINNIISGLRLDIVYLPGANPIDLALLASHGGVVDLQDTMVHMVPTTGHVVGRAYLPQHSCTVTLSVFYILKPISGFLLDN